MERERGDQSGPLCVLRAVLCRKSAGLIGLETGLTTGLMRWLNWFNYSGGRERGSGAAGRRRERPGLVAGRVDRRRRGELLRASWDRSGARPVDCAHSGHMVREIA